MKTNLLVNLPAQADNEIFQTLLAQDGVRIERIISTGQCSPAGFWYDQTEGEWVMLLSGAAKLNLADPDEILELNPGDCINIPPHRRHRIEWAHPVEQTIWLAVFYGK